MVSILPGGARTPWDVIGSQIGANLSQNLPGAVQQGYQRQIGLSALDRAEQEIAQSNGDPYKIALAFAKAGAQNPNLERSLGPLLQTAMAGAKVNRAFPQGSALTGTSQTPNLPQQTQGIPTQPAQDISQVQTSEYIKPSPFNILTADQINAESERYAQALNDPNAYQTRQAQLQNQNAIANSQRQELENMALKSGVSSDELPRFLLAGGKFNTANPAQWLQNTKREYDKIKSNDRKLERSFIPGLGSGLLGRNREKILKGLEQTVQDQVKAGLEEETRKYLASQYLSPTEVESLINPLTPEKEKAINALPKGVFPPQKAELVPTTPIRVPPRKGPFISYEEAMERAPNELKVMQNRLADFFLKNVDDKTSLLVLRDKLWNDKDYDWRQIGPAIREAEKRGLKLNPRQSTEMADIEGQPPIQSLPDMFQDLDRIIQYHRGNK